MKIVVVDGATLNPGDLSWSELEVLGECSVYDTTGPEKVLERCRDAVIVITNKVCFDREVITSLPKLKYIGVSATGYNVVDIETANERGIPVSNVATYGTQSVAQMVFAHLLEWCHHVGHHGETVREGRWCQSKDFCYWDYPLIELADLTMGIIGFGRIGQATAGLAKAFGMEVIAYDVLVDKTQHSDIEFVDLDTLFSRSDVVSLHCPLTKDSKGIINKTKLSLMKKTAFLINTSRGGLVNEKDLAEFLNSGCIAGAGLDVLSCEPPSRDNPLLKAKNCHITPHIAWATRSARARLIKTTVGNVKAFLEGRAENVVNTPT